MGATRTAVPTVAARAVLVVQDSNLQVGQDGLVLLAIVLSSLVLTGCFDV